MTQNLDLDLSTSKALTPDGSDVSRSWAPDNNTLTDGTQTTSDYEAEWSWNLGDYVLTTPNAGTSCGTSDKSDFGDCTSVGFQSVSDMTPMTDGNATDVISGNTYNAHYHVGNHYTWNAATAGTGGTITSTNATDSICPKGWQLPPSNNSDPGSFQALTNAYNVNYRTIYGWIKKQVDGKDRNLILKNNRLKKELDTAYRIIGRLTAEVQRPKG